MTDVLLVGGGLANALLALRLRQRRPGLSTCLIERGAAVGGDKTWSFHDEDVPDEQRRWLVPLAAASWTGYSVRFPSFARRLGGGYHSIASRQLHRAVAEALGDRLLLEREVREVSALGVTLADGSVQQAACVLDGRGLTPPLPFAAGYQKFLGVELRLVRDCGLREPLLMDATVEQREGYRFVYVLPFAPRRVLIEDTRYSDSPEIDAESLRGECLAYAERLDLAVEAVEREERGVLPIPLDGEARTLLEALAPGVAGVGVRVGLFHPTTGYSLPDAACAADALAALDPLSGDAAARLMRERALAAWRKRAFFRLLNRLLFRAAEPGQRFRVLEHFYRLPEPLIRRFYAARLSALDRLRILTGRPPVPIWRAARVLADASFARAGLR